MRTVIALTLISLAIAGCATEQKQSELRGSTALRSGETIRNAAIEQAIVTQHTLYPYHFLAGSAELNELGWRDLGVLVRHFAHVAGEVNLARGGVSDSLYESRSQTLLTALSKSGIAKERVRVVDGHPGGDGIAGARLVKIMDDSANPLGAAPRAGTGSSSAAMTGVQQ